ncbi:hypothetical protein G0Q06_00180 [Puniceicoccales bacterium CK1056]|uniref:Uncharacterized protein n=1 Tax=Oceanipulchritudo coccoides TaxID=2706888 RepID=A0A6B2LXP4_9BACT|nr:hypothetical protein [Oceanipulchritudo coccoides]NDV60862.1 hypothetical protein [Oceanipulchritudo coccoides]
MQEAHKKKAGSRSLWVWVILAFVILISAWTCLIIVASKNQPEVIEIQEP